MKNLAIIFLFLLFFALGCGGSGDGDGFDPLGLNDETAKATELVNKANEDLREIRKIQRANVGKLEQLQQAMSDRDTPQVRKILDDLIDAIGDGLALGETAIARIDDATEKKTNETYNEYLRLKEQALRKQIDAFKFRLDVAKTLREKFGTEDQAEIEKAKADFQRQEENFDKLWEAAEELNDRAERLRRENPTKIRAR
jgi:hypothetical protein